MMLNRPPGPRSILNIWLLMAVSDGCEEIRFRQLRGGYEMWWLVNGARYDGVPPLPGYVRRFANILWQLSHGGPGLGPRVRQFVRRLGSVTERGVFDLPVGPEFVVAVSHRAVWWLGRVAELAINLGESAALSVSGIAKGECEMAWHGPLSE
jgi:hypothetical protein